MGWKAAVVVGALAEGGFAVIEREALGLRSRVSGINNFVWVEGNSCSKCCAPNPLLSMLLV